MESRKKMILGCWNNGKTEFSSDKCDKEKIYEMVV